MRIGTVSLVKAPLGQVLEWVAYHRSVGVDEMHIFFDDPTDPALAALGGQRGVVTYACDEEFWARHLGPGVPAPAVLPDRQYVVVNSVLNDPEIGLDWLAHVDADELIWAPGNVRAALERECREGVDHLQLPPMEAVPPRLNVKDPFRDTTLFKRERPDRVLWARRMGVRHPFRGKHLLRGHRKGKAIVRPGAVPRIRAHGPPPAELASGGFVSRPAKDLWILHFDSGSYADWRRKWENRATYADRLSQSRRRQTQRYDRIASRGGGRRRRRAMRRLYRREYMLSARDARILRALGMVRRIRLEAALFDFPGAVAPSAGARNS